MNLPFPLHIPDYLAKLGITAELNEAISFGDSSSFSFYRP